MIKEILKQLKDIRNKKGLSQENMAQMLGISSSTFAKMEEGKSRLHIEKLEQVAKVLNVGVFSFFGLPAHYGGENNADFDRIVKESLLGKIRELEKENDLLKKESEKLKVQ